MSTVEWAFVVCRFIHFTALMTWFGAALFSGLYGRPPLAERLHAPRNVACMAWLTLSSALLMVPVQAAQMGDGWPDAMQPAMWLAVMGTTFGRVWLWHIVGVLMAWSLVVIAPRMRCDRGPTARVQFVLTGILLMSLGLLGHAAMRTGWSGALQRANHALHLLSTAAWVGTLPPLLPLLRVFDPRASNPDDRVQGNLEAEARRAMQRFSRVGHVAVLAALATGVANIAWIVGAWPWQAGATSSAYRFGLTAKLILVAVMIAIAVFNRYALVPAIARAQRLSAPDPGRPAGAPAALTALRVLIWVEMAFALLVVWLVSGFATFDPR